MDKIEAVDTEEASSMITTQRTLKDGNVAQNLMVILCL